jgi:hypothetical protein
LPLGPEGACVVGIGFRDAIGLRLADLVDQRLDGFERTHDRAVIVDHG